MNPDERIFLLTDLCMWESNKKNTTSFPHAIEVVDIETGAVHYIKSGSRIIFVDGHITARATQEAYNSQVRRDGQNLPQRTRSKGTSKPIQNPEDAGV